MPATLLKPVTDAEFVRGHIAELVAQLAPGESFMLDSHLLANAVFERRQASGDWVQTKDYTQHLLRESAHVCRHADGHHYRVHRDELCSSDCDARFASSAPRRVLGHSACCGLELTAVGTCPWGCDD